VSLPRTAYLWAGLLILALLLGGRIGRKAPDGGTPLTGTNFQEVVLAEQQARVGFSSLGSAVAMRGTDPLVVAYASYSKLARQRPVPTSTRRALIVGHAAKKPLDTALLTDLKQDLDGQKTPVVERDAELRLWAALYETTTTTSVEQGDEKRIRQMRLGLLEDRALADLYQKQGRAADAKAAIQRLTDAATRSTLGFGALGLITSLATLLGLGFLVLFIVAATKRRWELVGRVGTQPQHVPPGPLLDVFLFYLAIYRIAVLLLSLALSQFPAFSPVPLMLLVQLGTGVAAILYARWRTRQNEGSLEHLGWHPKSLLTNALYGIAGWCAALPVLLVVGMLSQRLFHGSNNAPNPVLPLLASDRAVLDRVLIFCLAALGAPLFEEFFFRGALFTAFRKTTPWVLAVLLSGVVFAMVHPVQDWLPILALGFVLGTLREMRQSLVPGIVVHFLQNAFAFTLITTLFGLLQ
jgi:membrane protease YdiL (CAAX protease family)